MQFFDSHCHFDFAVFDIDRDHIWSECQSEGITNLIIPGVAPDQWSIAANIAQQYRNIYFGVGVHPWWIRTQKDAVEYLEKTFLELQKNIKRDKCVAIGECGLDATIDTPMQLQQQILDMHLQLAQQTLCPLIIHCRKAHNEMLVQLKRYDFPAGGVIHGFSGSYELAVSYWNMGFRLGIGGSITYERANKTREAVQKLPLEAILLETDAPDMPLSGKQGQCNSPAHIIEIAQTLAGLRGEPLEKIAAQTSLNSRTLFKIDY